MDQRGTYDGPDRGTPPTHPYYPGPPAVPQARRATPLWVTAVVGVAAMAVGFALGSGSKSTATTSTSPGPTMATVAATTANTGPGPATPTTTKAAASAPAPAKAGIGSPIDIKGDKDGDVLEVTLVKIVDPATADNEFSSPDPGKHFIGIQFKLVNKGTSEYDDDPQIDVKVKDGKGQSFDAEIATTLTAGPALDSGLKLPAGDTALGYVTFQLPSGSKAAKVQYTLNGFGNTGQWTLG